MSEKSIASQIRARVASISKGSPFVASDFADIATLEETRRELQRMTERGLIDRVLPGVYVALEWSALLDESVPADPNDVANAIARKNGWTTTPSGNTALNRLGLSTQVPSVWSYVSDGPYAEYPYGKTTIRFKHTANRNISGMSPLSRLIVQAIKALGKDDASAIRLKPVFARMSDTEKANLLAETQRATSWIRKAITDTLKEL